MSGINWPGLFAWSTKYHDGTGPSQFSKMTDEDREFLEKAMADAFGGIEDPNKVFEEAIAQCKSTDRTEESVCTALEVIDRLCDDPDVGRNAEKLGGIKTLLELLPVYSGPGRSKTYEVLALLFSNNPNIQEAGLKHDGMAILLNLTRSAPKGSADRSHAFRTLVALVRQVPAYETTLLRSEDGATLLVELLGEAEEPRTREKVCSFVTGLTVNGVLQEVEAEAFAAPLAALLTVGADEGANLAVQYRETVAACAQEVARFSPAGCRATLLGAAEARLAAIVATTEKAEGDDGAEQASLEECVTLLQLPA